MKKMCIVKLFFIEYKILWFNKNVFWYHEKSDTIKIFIEYKFILIE